MNKNPANSARPHQHRAGQNPGKSAAGAARRKAFLPPAPRILESVRGFRWFHGYAPAWPEGNRSRRTDVSGESLPMRADEYHFYQALIGIWPQAAPDETQLGVLRERLKAYMLKAAREAKLRAAMSCSRCMAQPDVAPSRSLTSPSEYSAS